EELQRTLRRAVEVELDGGADLFLAKLGHDRDRLWRDAAHEGGHAISAIGTGLKVTYVSILGPVPYCRYEPTGDGAGDGAPGQPMAQLIRTVAGHVGEAGGAFTMPPAWGFVTKYIERARARQGGTCDSCCAAQILVDAYPERPDRELVQTWLGA